MARPIIGKKMKLLRVEKDLSTMDVAKITGLSQGYISNIENNEDMNPTKSTIKKLAAALGVTAEFLIDESTYIPNEVIENLPPDIQEWLVEKDIVPYLYIAQELHGKKIPAEKAAKVIELFKTIMEKDKA